MVRWGALERDVFDSNTPAALKNIIGEEAKKEGVHPWTKRPDTR